jgi:transposase
LRGRLVHYKQKHVYVGIDLHKETHTAVVIDCWNKKLAEVQIANRPTAFSTLLEKVRRAVRGLQPVFGLEDVGGYGRSLAVFLLEKGQVVKEVNAALSYAQRISNPTTQKSDSWDAFCVACVLLARLEELPDANPQDVYWTLGQLVNRRDALVKASSTLQNQLHTQLSHHYPSYRRFFNGVDGKAALAFWEKYPAPHHLDGVNEQELAAHLRAASRNACSTKKAETILELAKADGATRCEHQDSRDFIVRSIVRDIRFKKQEISEVEAEFRRILDMLDYKLESMPGVNTVTACALIAGIGDIGRFPSADKLARFAGIAPVRFSSGGKGKDQKSRQGNRTLHGIFYFLAVQQVQVAKCSQLPRNPVMYQYYQKKLSEGKTKMQALVCVMRKLVNIVYRMMRNRTEYVMPALPEKVAV